MVSTSPATASAKSEKPPYSVTLPAPRLSGPMSLEDTLKKRRSVREFPKTPLTLEEVSQLLWAAQGITQKSGGLRTAPSAGALFPLEVLIAAERVQGLSPGIYRYDTKKHNLALTAGGNHVSALAKAALDQKWVGDASAVMVISAVYERTRARYAERAERYAHMEAGAAAQNVLLQAESLGLNSVLVGAFEDRAVKAVLSMPAEENPLYIIPIGRKKR